MVKLEDSMIVLPVEVEDQVLKDISYSREQLEQDLVQLKEWLKNQNHLPPSRLKENDNFLKMYLTGCKGSLETCKKKLDCYYSYRGHSEIYNDRDVTNEQYRKSCESNNVVILPKATKEGDYIFISKLMTPDLDDYDVVNIAKRYINITEMGFRLRAINTPIYVVFDWLHFSASHSLTVTPSLVRDTLLLLQDVFPTRIKKIIFFNVNSVIEVMVNNLIKPFMSKKLRERILVTSEGVESVYPFIDKSLLPSDFGGDMKSLKEYNDIWNEYELRQKDWFLNELSEVTDETKRINFDNDKILKADSYFGVQGTLKKLVID